MATGLNQRALARYNRIVKSLENGAKFSAKIRPEDIHEACKRDMISVGISSGSSSPGFASARKGSSSSASPVERAVLAKYGNKDDGPDIEKHVHDPYREDFKKAERKIFEAEALYRQAYEILEFLKSGVEKVKDRVTTAPCEACLVLPATRQGFCDGCFLEWTDYGAPDRQRWVAYKTGQLNSEGRTLVTDMPPARHPEHHAS